MEYLTIALYGAGKVGRELIKNTYNPNKFRYVAIADTSGVIVKKDSFNEEELRTVVELKENKGKVRDKQTIGDMSSNAVELTFKYLKPDVFVDVSSTQSYDILLNALDNGIHVMGSNKQPYSDTDFSQYQKLIKIANENKRNLDNRTTVSANLGILTRVKEFVNTGGISRIDGCLSGTMAYISHRINQLVPFSQALSESVEMGYTEPDERDDITGKDFKRKCVIIARQAGIPLELSMIQFVDIFPKEFLDLPLEEFRRRLPEFDDEIKEKVRKAQEKKCAYRFMGSLDFGKHRYEIGFKEIPLTDPQASVQGCFNKVTIYPNAWNVESITIEGPGAGILPTMQGLLAGLYDIFELNNRIS